MDFDALAADVRLLDGVTLAERPKGRVERKDDMSLPEARTNHKTYAHGILLGKPAYTNGFMLLQGEHAKATGEDMGDKLTHVTPHHVMHPVTPVGFATADVPAVWFSDGGALNAGIYDHVMKRYPGATFHRDPETKLPAQLPFLIRVDGLAVGMAMPVTIHLVPRNLRAALAPEVLAAMDKSALAQARQDLREALRSITVLEKAIASAERRLADGRKRSKKDREAIEKELAADRKRLQSRLVWRDRSNETIAFLEATRK